MTYEDISGSAAGFHFYDDCDIHIGFRVHAHIYNLSIGNASILINEDARGYGVNDALALRDIRLEKTSFGFKNRNVVYLRKQLADYFEFLTETDFRQYRISCQLLREYYNEMREYIKSIGLL